MKSYFQGMITGGSLIITFFVLTASQIPIAEDSGTFNTLNVETINVSKAINLNDRVFIYQNPEDDDEYRIDFYDSNGNNTIGIMSNKLVSGMVFYQSQKPSLVLYSNYENENSFIGFFDGESISNEINKNEIIIRDNDQVKIDLGLDTNKNGLMRFFNNNQYKTITIGHDVNSNGRFEIKNNYDKQTFILGHDNEDDGLFQISDKYGDKTHESP